ncbi:vWA domain-containing protein [Haliangium sp.]|uniref:vWA domain-containing protein n=1 Tax=Haliangium sp. TaxID=2663208 RepID=UPI003D111301
MKIGTLVALACTGMTATSVAVWTTTRPAPDAIPTTAIASTTSPAPAASTPTLSFTPADPQPLAATPDQSSFVADGTLRMEGRIGHAVLPAGASSETFLFVDLSAADQIAQTRAPLDLSIVIDRSGSMKGKRLRNAVAAARTAIQRLDDGDVVSVVSYSTNIEIDVPATTITPQSRPRVLAALDGLRARGDTCISCGIQTGMQLIGQRPGRVSRLLLLSDGEATAGVRNEDGFRRIAEQCRRMGTAITSIGVDVDYNERIMATLARSSNGRHFFVESAAGLPAIFDQEMQRLLRTVATDTALAVDLAPGVFVEEVFDRGFRQEGSGRLVVPLGTFAAGERKTLLARLRVPGTGIGQRPVADVRLSYRDLVTDRASTGEGRLAALMSNDPAQLAPLDGLVSARISQSVAATTLEKANALASRGDVSGAQSLIREQKRELSQRRARSAGSVSANRRVDFDKGFDELDDILGGAAEGFADAPAADPSASGAGAGRFARPPAARKNKAQVRANQAAAVELGF